MGGLLSFELARELRRRELPVPACLFVSGYRAPQLMAPYPPTYQLAEVEFLSQLCTMGGTPDDVIRNQELMELFVPLLRADFELCETYVYTPEEPLDCRIFCFGGLEDRRVSREELLAWRVQSRMPLLLRFFPGDHFFLHSSRTLLARTVSQDLKELLRQLGRRRL